MKTGILAIASAMMSALLLSGGVQATETWTSSLCTQNGTSVGNSFSCGGSVSVNVTGWSTTVGTPTGTTSSSGADFAAATVKQYSGGFGVEADAGTSDTGTPNHALDNNQYTDTLFLNFGANELALTQVTLGYPDYTSNYDSDISILAYTGTALTPPNIPSIAGKSVNELTATGGGWTLVGHYANLSKDNSTSDGDGLKTATITNQDGENKIASSWWLISAYDPGYGTGSTEHGGTTGYCSGLSYCTKDYVKVLSFAGNRQTYETPEPGSMVLFGVGLFGIMALRRRRQDLV